MSIRYRPEIDGLRTIAVLSVVVYHARFAMGDAYFLPGGFFGVDIFFVISGYLITALLLKELLEQGRVSLSAFYERRVRRLLPALLVVIIACLPFAWQFLGSEGLVDFAKSAIASLFFSSNFYWYGSLQEYGAVSSLRRPLLHTWSLAVEEQFYILFPLFLALLWRLLGRWLGAGLALLMVVGLVCAAWLSTSHPSMSFYLLPSRIWELLAGSVLAVLQWRHPRPLLPAMAEAGLAWFGLGLILVSFGFSLQEINHPGYISILPVLGTMLIIRCASGGDMVSRLLASRPFVGIGLISYSLYLWHYPVFAFARNRWAEPAPALMIGLILLSVLLAVLSYFLVEKPARRSGGIGLPKLLLLLGAGYVLVTALSVLCIVKDGYPSRFAYLESLFDRAGSAYAQRDGVTCLSFGPGGTGFPLKDSCVFEHAPGRPYIALVGDSHAAMLSASLLDLVRRNDLNLVQVTEAGCEHLPGLRPGRRTCKSRSRRLPDYLAGFDIAALVYAARLPMVLNASYFDNGEGGVEWAMAPLPPGITEASMEDRERRVFDGIQRLTSLADQLVLVYPFPEQGYNAEFLLTLTRPIIDGPGELPELSVSYDGFKARTQGSYALLDAIEGRAVKRVYPERLFCRDLTGRCHVNDGERLYFPADNHVSRIGADLVVGEIADALALD